MKSNRRSVLIGLGALTVGGGAVFGTGAFSSVEAERTVTINVDADSDALLGLAPSGQGDSSTAIQTTGDGELSINFDTLGNNNEGVNVNSVTTIGELSNDDDELATDGEALTITNNGSQTVEVTFDIEFSTDQTDLENTNVGDVFKLLYDDGSTNPLKNLVSTSFDLDSGASEDLALQIDTTAVDANDSVVTDARLFTENATITATDTSL